MNKHEEQHAYTNALEGFQHLHLNVIKLTVMLCSPQHMAHMEWHQWSGTNGVAVWVAQFLNLTVENPNDSFSIKGSFCDMKIGRPLCMHPYFIKQDFPPVMQIPPLKITIC